VSVSAIPASGDALAECLAQVTRLFGHPSTSDALLAGLPVDEAGLTPDIFMRAAERAGYVSRVIKTDMDRLSKLDLPAVLLLKERGACVLTARNDTEASIVTGAGIERVVPLAELNEQYDGLAIAVARVQRFEAGTASERMLSTHHWFWGTLARAWPLYTEVAIASVLVNAFTVLAPLFSMNVYDRVVPNKALDTFWVLAVGVMIMYLFDLGLKLLRGYFIDVAGRRADIALSAGLFEQVMGMRLDAGRQSVGSLANNLREFESLREFFTSATMVTLIDLPFVVLFIVVIGLVGGWQMALVPLVAIPLVVGVGVALQAPLRNRIRRVYQASETKNATLIETLSAIETVKALGAASRQQRRWEEVVGFVASEGLGTRLISSFAVNFSAWVQAVVSVATLAVGVYLASDNALTTGAIVACTIIGGRAMAPLAQIAGLLTRYHQSMSALESLEKIMAAPRERPQDRSFIHRPVLTGDIRFQDVTFRYPGQEMDALSGFNLTIKAGDRVGIIGRIGSGKTTLAKLLIALYQPQTGSILVDGTDIRSIDPTDLRSAVGYLPQNLVLFSGSVRDNLQIGTRGVDDAALLRAAGMAGLLDIVSRHPKGFDMPVGERGESLSGGPRQKVGFARALVADPPLLIIDEPTQALDHSAEERLKARIAEDMKDKTIIIITHRDSLLSVVNTLVVVDGGKVVAAGPREAVIKALSEGKVRMAR
jgi:ATP-binding cassette subfamily C protein LapB